MAADVYFWRISVDFRFWSPLQVFSFGFCLFSRGLSLNHVRACSTAEDKVYLDKVWQRKSNFLHSALEVTMGFLKYWSALGGCNPDLTTSPLLSRFR